MSQNDRIDHLFWVKTLPEDVEINLAYSNMQFLLKPEELPFDRDSIRLHNFPGDARLGSRHLLETISRRESVPGSNILLSLGTSLANYLLWSVLLHKGDEVLVEFPAYEPMIKVPRQLGAKVRYLKREPADFSLSVAAIADTISDKTRMIILTDSHNPSGNQLSHEVLEYLKTLCRERQIIIFIDEVYSRFYRKESLFIDYPEFIVTSSLSKYYGLGSMRIGWAFAPAEIVEKALDFLDYLNPELPFPSLYLAHLLLNHPVFGVLEERVQQRVKRNRELVIDYLNRTDFLSSYLPKNGILFFPQVRKKIDVQKFHSVLYEKYRTLVTPGSFFAMPRHFRITAIWDEETIAEGLRRLEAALGESSG